MKVLIYMPYMLWTMMYPIALEIAKKHIDNDDEVHVFFCNGELRGCDYNPEYLWERCKICRIRTKKCLNLCTIPLKNRHSIKINENYIELPIPEFNNIKELKEYKLEGINFGMGVASSVITKYFDSSPQFTNKLKNEIKVKLLIAYAIYNFAKKIIYKINPDIVYIPNGRLDYLFPVFCFCQNDNINVYTFEVASLPSKYSIIKGSFFDIDNLMKDLFNFWDNSFISEDEKCSLAEQFYEEKLLRKEYYSYTKKQDYGFLPESIQDKIRVISIFITAEDEIEAIEGWENPLFSDQLDGLKYIFNEIDDNNIRFYVRIHPRLSGINNSQTRGLKSLPHFDNVEIIEADSQVDSYELIKKSEKVVVFGSTVGIESTYYGVPTILLGRAFYEKLNVAYIPSTKEESIILIKETNLQPKPKIGAFKYGFYTKFNGEDHQYYKSDTFGKTGTFMGEQIEGTPYEKRIARIMWCHNFLTHLILKLCRILRRTLSFDVVKRSDHT